MALYTHLNRNIYTADDEAAVAAVTNDMALITSVAPRSSFKTVDEPVVAASAATSAANDANINIFKQHIHNKNLVALKTMHQQHNESDSLSL